MEVPPCVKIPDAQLTADKGSGRTRINLWGPKSKTREKTHLWPPRQLQWTRCPLWSERRRCISQHASTECCESWCRLPIAGMFERLEQSFRKLLKTVYNVAELRCSCELGEVQRQAQCQNDFCSEWLYYIMEAKGPPQVQGRIKTVWREKK